MDDRRGFTLLEVLVSLAILSITLLLAYQVLSGAIAAEDRSERWTVASCLGETLVRESTAVWPETGEIVGKVRAPDGGVLLEALDPSGRAPRRPGSPCHRHLVLRRPGGAGLPRRRRRQMTRPPVRRGGFTLLEILLALSVLSVILLLLLSAFTGAARVRETLSSRSRGFPPDPPRPRPHRDRPHGRLRVLGAGGVRALPARGPALRDAGGDAHLHRLPASRRGRRPPARGNRQDPVFPEDRGRRRHPRAAPGAIRPPVHREQDPRQGIRGGGRAAGLPRRVVRRDARGSRSGPSGGGTKTALPKKAAVTLVDASGETYRREVPIPLAGQEANRDLVRAAAPGSP